MFYRTIFVCFVGSILVELVKTDSRNFPEITFTTVWKVIDHVSHLTCDHNGTSMQNNKYTVLEGKELKIILKHNSFINHFICRDYNYQTQYNYKPSPVKNVTTFIAQKNMSTLWNCTVLTFRDNSEVFQPVVLYEGHTYAAAYCYMKIHVRQTEPPQTILVNNMALQAVRTDLSEKNVDFTAEYRYADGDVVNVACVNFLGTARLTMEYPMADTLSDNFTSRNLSSSQAIGFSTKLHAGHNNSYMICTDTERTDYTKIMVRFVMRTELNIVSIKINGMTLRPKLNNPYNHQYEIEYKYISNLLIKVVCEVERADVVLVDVLDCNDCVSNVTSYKKTGIKPSKQREMSFHLSGETKTLACGSDFIKGRAVAELITIKFSEGKFLNDQYSVQMKLPANGTVMELYAYSDDNTRFVIFYEFENDESLELKCGPLLFPLPGPLLYIQMKDSICVDKDCYVPQNLTLTDQHVNSEIVCRIMEQNDMAPSKKDKVLKEIRVIFRKKVLTTTSPITTTTTTTTTTDPPTNAGSRDLPKTTSSVAMRFSNFFSGEKDKNNTMGTASDPGIDLQTLVMIAGAVICIIVICVPIVYIKLRKRNHSQGDPHDNNYENLATPSETSMPAFPAQWESNYAVPVDRRTDDTTYSVPCNEPALYSTPTPKNLRNKKQKPIDPTYAVLEVPNAQGRKNVFKETDDPNYSEVYANSQEQCYAKVLPKSVRNKMGQDNNPYSYVTNEPSYANTGEPEPMYCEPAKAAAGQYANLNSSHYANSNAQEYVEPTYCEPQKPRK